MRVVITGDRYWGHSDGPNWRAEALSIHCALSTLDPETDFVVLGDAPGADTVARLACEELGLPYRVHEADWKTYGRAAGPIRNRAMLDDLIVAEEDREVWYFHANLDASRGTKNCVEQARKRGLTIRDGREV